MKNLRLLLLLGLASLNANAQRIIEKNLKYDSQEIIVELKFASNIEVNTWDKPTIYLKAEIDTEESKFLDLFDLKVEKDESKIKIRSETNTIFDAFYKVRKMNRSTEKNGDALEFYHEYNYELFIPKNAKLKIRSIDGNLKSDFFDGELSVDIINGDIKIIKFNGDLDLKSVNGELDVIAHNSNIIARTFEGNIYADPKMELSLREKISGREVRRFVKKFDNSLFLNTLYGNIYLNN